MCRLSGSAALQPGLVWLSSSPFRVVCHQSVDCIRIYRIYDVSSLMLADLDQPTPLLVGLPARESFFSFEIAIRRSKLTPIQKHAKLNPNSHRLFGQPTTLTSQANSRSQDFEFTSGMRENHAAGKNVIGLHVGVSSTKKVYPERLAWS